MKQYDSPQMVLYHLSDIMTADGVITPSTEILPYNYYGGMEENDYVVDPYGDDA